MCMLEVTYRKIKNLHIQGAANISTAGIKALENEVKKGVSLTELERGRRKLISARATEPELENYLEYIVNYYKMNGRENSLKEIRRLLKDKKEGLDKIGRNGARVLERGDKVFTHCHSLNVIAVLKEAKKKKIKVWNTETRPRLQGRMTAKELARMRIPVTHVIDSASRIALKECDVMLIGADAITHNRVYNKIGSELMALTARSFHVPVYVCASLWKFNQHRETIEERNISEIWKRPPKGVKVMNFSFEKVNFKLVKRIICEEGVLKPKKFVKRARKMLKF